jgi:hypothetical protein
VRPARRRRRGPRRVRRRRLRRTVPRPPRWSVRPRFRRAPARSRPSGRRRTGRRRPSRHRPPSPPRSVRRRRTLPRTTAVLLGEVDTEGTGAPGDRCEGADAVRIPGRVEEREVTGRRVGEEIHPFQPEMRPEGLDVVDLPVAAVRRRVGRDGGIAGPPQIQQEQPTVPRQSAEVAEVGGGTHGPTGQTEQRLALARDVVGQLSPVGGGEDRHSVILITTRRSGQAFFTRRRGRSPRPQNVQAGRYGPTWTSWPG